MTRLFMAICLAVVLAASAAVAQSQREKLEGFGGLKFGMSYEEARRILGANIEQGAWGNDKQLSTKLSFAGEQHFVTYTFDQKQKLKRVTIVPEKKNLDRTVCVAGGNLKRALEQQFGAPTIENPGPDWRKFLFKFKDGNSATLSSMYVGFCLVRADFHVPGGGE